MKMSLAPKGQQIGLLDVVTLEGIAGMKVLAEWIDETKKPLANQKVDLQDIMTFGEVAAGAGLNFASKRDSAGSRIGLDLFAHGMPEMSVTLYKIGKGLINKSTTTTPTGQSARNQSAQMNAYRNYGSRSGMPDVRATSVPPGGARGYPTVGYSPSQFT